jgi:hypothetical protein
MVNSSCSNWNIFLSMFFIHYKMKIFSILTTFLNMLNVSSLSPFNLFITSKLINAIICIFLLCPFFEQR